MGSAIRAEIAPLRANQIAGNTVDFKMNACNNNGLLTEREVCTVKYQTEVF
jgi:hypothetical protein